MVNRLQNRLDDQLTDMMPPFSDWYGDKEMHTLQGAIIKILIIVPLLFAFSMFFL